MRLVGRAIRIVQSRVEDVGILEFAAQVHGEFEFPAHGFDDVGGGDFIAIGVVKGDFDVGPLLKGGDFEVDAEAAAIGIGLGGEGGNLRFFGDGAGEVVFGEEKIHARNYTLRDDVPRQDGGLGAWL